MVGKEDSHEKQMKLFAEQLETFIDRVITVALAPYVIPHARIDDMEARVKEDMRLEEMQARVSGASSSSAPRAGEQMIGVIASLESQTLLTPSPTTKAT
ncbi:hypothetical protein HAX54_044105 [Datura stramonium]|uniref:Uncharacterized protein n=1 Tax=Datura stramonium TaxID=4076 RepID=A0ABS8W247_DATST|nr:hypothetical protein [Datura stramonium]